MGGHARRGCDASISFDHPRIGDGSRTWPYLPKVYDFKDGKLWPNDRPGLGVAVDTSRLTQIGNYTTYRAGMLMNQRPDGSFTNW